MQLTAQFGLTMILASACAQGSVLKLVIENEQGQKLPCRILVQTSTGVSLVPDRATLLEIGPDRWFMSSGETRLDIPEDRQSDSVSDQTVELRVERGPEYLRVKEKILLDGPEIAKTIVLRRWVDMGRQGYRSGENHLHVDSEKLRPMLAAEDLDFGTSMTWWNGPGNDWCLPVPPGEGKSRLLEFAGHKTPTSIYDGEVEYSWGAVYFLHLSSAMPLSGDPQRPNLDFLKHISSDGGFVFYQAGWSREVAVDALLGYVDGVNVNNNNFHMHRFQPRSRYSNLLEVEGFPIYPNTEEGMLRMNLETYYRLLNWGLRLAAGAGSATGFKEVPVGYNRAYVRTGGDVSLHEFYQAWSNGENFVTNGPMIFLETGSGQRPGDELSLPQQGGSVVLRVEAMWEQPLSSLDLIVNGEVVFSLPDLAPRLREEKRVLLEHSVLISKGAWIAARCTARDELLTDRELSRYANSDRQQPSRLRYAHTSPIYVSVGGKSAAVRRSIEEGFQMLRQFEVFARKTCRREFLPGILTAVEQARGRLSERLE